MPLPSHLHTYPKIFNRKGNLKAFPFRRPLTINYWYMFLASTAILWGTVYYQEWIFSIYTKS